MKHCPPYCSVDECTRLAKYEVNAPDHGGATPWMYPCAYHLHRAVVSTIRLWGTARSRKLVLR